MDGYPDFVLLVAAFASVTAVIAGALARPSFRTIAAVAAATFVGVLIYLIRLSGPDIATGALIAASTLFFVSPLICIGVLLGTTVRNLLGRKI